MSCDLSTNAVTECCNVAVVVNMKFIEECKIFIKSFHEVKVYRLLEMILLTEMQEAGKLFCEWSVL